MNREKLSKVCELVGGQTRLGTMIGVTYSTMRRKCNGESEITKGDGLKVRLAVSLLLDELRESLDG